LARREVMEEQDVTALIAELVEYARVLTASVEDRDSPLVQSSATCLRENVTPLYEFLSKQRPVSFWGSASASAWLTMVSAQSVQEHSEVSDVDWDQVGAAVSFAESGVDQFVAHWNEVLQARP